MTAENARPIIGVFDSGVGGLTVLRELLAQVPGADYLYFGDTARLPYGSKSAETIAKYACSAVKFLAQQGATMTVIACNTACALAYPEIERCVNIPVMGVIRPGAEAAAKASHTQNVVVIATEGTVGSHAYTTALAEWKVAAQEKACPLFVPLVEEGWTDHTITEQVAHIYIDEFTLPESIADVLLLGCTHYPLLKDLLRRVVPQQISIVDSAESTARSVADKMPRLTTSTSAPIIRFFATDSIEKFRRAGTKFLSHEIGEVTHVNIEL
jgi:glutamate racemase